MTSLRFSIRYRKNQIPILTIGFLLLLWPLANITASGQWLPFYAIVFAIVVAAMYHSPSTTIALFIGVNIGEYLSVGFTSHYLPGLNFGPIHFQPTDILCLCLAVSLSIRFARFGSSTLFKSALLWIFIIFSVIVVFGIIRGLGIYSESAIGEARHYLYFVLLVLYFSIYRLSKTESMRLIGTCGVFVCIIVVFGLLRAIGVVPGGVSVNRFKVVHASQALFLLFAFFGLLVIYIRHRKHLSIIYFSSLALLLGITLMQHRSVWIATIIGTSSLIVMFRINLLKFIFPSIMFLLLLMFLTPMISPHMYPYITNKILVSAREPLQLSERNTASWRLAGWISILNELDGAKMWMIGKGYGGYFARKIYGVNESEKTNLHSFYVTTVSRLGILGVAIFALFTFKLGKKLYRIRQGISDEFFHNLISVVFVCIIASLGYMVAYGLDIYISILFAIGTSYALQEERFLCRNIKEGVGYGKSIAI